MSLSIEFPTPPRSSFATALVDQKLYIVGGHLGKFHKYDSPHFCANGHVVDLRNGKVTPIDYPFPVQGARLIEYKGDLFCFGGFVYEPGLDKGPGEDMFDWYARSTNEVYSLSNGATNWKEVCHLPRPRSSYVAGRIGKFAYLIAGWDGTPWKKDDWGGRFHSSIEIFDLELQQFIPNIIEGPSPQRRALTSVVMKDEIILIGGLGMPPTPDDEGPYFNLVTNYDTKKAVFSDNVYPPLPKGLFSPGACNLNGTLVVAGGVEKKTHSVNSDIFILYPEAKSWSTNSHKPSRIGSFPELFPVGSDRVLIIGAHDTESTGEPLGLFETISID